MVFGSRRLRVGECLGEVFKVMAVRSYILLPLTLLVQTPMYCYVQMSGGEVWADAAALSVLYSPIAMVCLSGLLSYSILSYFDQRRSRPKASIGLAVLAAIPKLVLLPVLAVLVVIFSACPSFVLGILIGSFSGDSSMDSTLGILLLAMLTWFVVAFLVTTSVASGPIFLAETYNPIRAIARSIELTKGNRLRIFATLLVLSVVTFVASSALKGVFIGFEAHWSLVMLPGALSILPFAAAASVFYASLIRIQGGSSEEEWVEVFE